MNPRLAIVFAGALALEDCSTRQKDAMTSPSTVRTPHRGIFATSSADRTHQLSITVDVAPDLRAPAGMTAILVTVRDRSQILVKDAVVYVSLDSRLGMTPKMIVVASNREDGTYTAELPLVYDSKWNFTVRAFSSGRSGVVTVVEDTN